MFNVQCTMYNVQCVRTFVLSFVLDPNSKLENEKEEDMMREGASHI